MKVYTDRPEDSDLPPGFELAGDEPELVKAGEWFLSSINPYSKALFAVSLDQHKRWLLRRTRTHCPMTHTEALMCLDRKCTSGYPCYTVVGITPGGVLLGWKRDEPEGHVLKVSYADLCEYFRWADTGEPCGILICYAEE